MGHAHTFLLFQCEVMWRDKRHQKTKKKRANYICVEKQSLGIANECNSVISRKPGFMDVKGNYHW